MKKRTKISAVIFLVALCVVAWFLIGWIYRFLDTGYQTAMDPIRVKHAEQISRIVMEYADKSGRLPFEEESKDGPFMVLIAHTQKEEDVYANEKVLKKGATFTNSYVLEAELGKVLQRDVRLPRDPQRVATYAPNVYIYFISKGEYTIAVHLFAPSEKSVRYQWRGGSFYSHTLSYSRKGKALE